MASLSLSLLSRVKRRPKSLLEGNVYIYYIDKVQGFGLVGNEGIYSMGII